MSGGGEDEARKLRGILLQPAERRKELLDQYVQGYYRAFLEPVPACRYEGALDLINPAPDRHAACEARIIRTVKTVEFAVTFKITSPAATREWLLEGADKLQAAAAVIGDPALQEKSAIRRTLAAAVPVAHGRPPKNDAKRIAVFGAGLLLEDFGKSPTLTRPSRSGVAAWHNLSHILYGAHRAGDLFQTMRDIYEESKRGLLRGTLSGQSLFDPS